MQCDKVIRELAVPTDERDSASLAEHLAQCPACTDGRTTPHGSIVFGKQPDRRNPRVTSGIQFGLEWLVQSISPTRQRKSHSRYTRLT